MAKGADSDSESSGPTLPTLDYQPFPQNRLPNPAPYWKRSEFWFSLVFGWIVVMLVLGVLFVILMPAGMSDKAGVLLNIAHQSFSLAAGYGFARWRGMANALPEPRSEGEFCKGATVPARIVAGVFCAFFLCVAIVEYRAVMAVVGCVCGAAFCFFVAVGRIGKHKRGWI